MRSRHLRAGARVENQLVVDMHLEVIAGGHLFALHQKDIMNGALGDPIHIAPRRWNALAEVGGPPIE